MMNQTDIEVLKDLTHVVNTLIEGNYKFKGIKYLYVSCSSHVQITRFRGIDIKMDNGHLEATARGLKTRLEVFAYYNNKCYQLLFE
jgi:hypothetical protein